VQVSTLKGQKKIAPTRATRVMIEEVFMGRFVAMKTQMTAESYNAFVDPPTKPGMAGND
jgi:hypothetical protein